MITQGRITQHVVVFPEDVFNAELYEPFMEELRKRGVYISLNTYTEEDSRFN